MTTKLWNRTRQLIRSMEKYTPSCYFICFGSILVRLMFLSLQLLGYLWNCVRRQTSSKLNSTQLNYTGYNALTCRKNISMFFYLVTMSQCFKICWKYYCIDVKIYFLLSSFSVVCHLKLSYYYHFVSCSHVCGRVCK